MHDVSPAILPSHQSALLSTAGDSLVVSPGSGVDVHQPRLQVNPLFGQESSKKMREMLPTTYDSNEEEEHDRPCHILIQTSTDRRDLPRSSMYMPCTNL